MTRLFDTGDESDYWRPGVDAEKARAGALGCYVGRENIVGAARDVEMSAGVKVGSGAAVHGASKGLVLPAQVAAAEALLD